MRTEPEQHQIDRGFEAEFSDAAINEMDRAFSKDDALQDLIYKMHDADNSYDLKRGEFYPELLRAGLGLKRALGRIYDIDPRQVQTNYGSNGSIDTVLAAVRTEEFKRLERWARDNAGSATAAPSGGGVLFPSPTYFRNHNSAKAKGLAVHSVPLDAEFRLAVPLLVAAIKEHRPSIVMLVTPNNPTGVPIDDADLLAVLDAVPSEIWVMIDRTLVNTKPELPTAEILRRYTHKNVVILHSFSKYHAMSHLRIGVALYSNVAMAAVVQPHLPLGIGLEACVKATRIVRAEGGIIPTAQVRANIEENRRILDAFVKKHPGFRISDFSANYCLLTLPAQLDSATFAEALQRRGLFVMAGAELPDELSSAIRLHTGGPPDYLRRFCAEVATMPIIFSRN